MRLHVRETCHGKEHAGMVGTTEFATNITAACAVANTVELVVENIYAVALAMESRYKFHDSRGKYLPKSTEVPRSSSRTSVKKSKNCASVQAECTPVRARYWVCSFENIEVGHCHWN